MAEMSTLKSTHEHFVNITVTGHGCVIGNESTLRMDIECGIGIAYGHYLAKLVDDAASSARWCATRGFSNGSSAGCVVIGTGERQQQDAFTWFSAELRELRIVIRNHLSTKNLAVGSIEDCE